MTSHGAGYYSVIAVLAEVDGELSFKGPWKLLDPAAIRIFNSGASITGLRPNDLLPANRDYFFYEGSMTSPDCSENVDWYVLKERIGVPRTFICKKKWMVQLLTSTTGSYKMLGNVPSSLQCLC